MTTPTVTETPDTRRQREESTTTTTTTTTTTEPDVRDAFMADQHAALAERIKSGPPRAS